MTFNPGPATVVLTGQKFITGAQVLDERLAGARQPSTADAS